MIISHQYKDCEVAVLGIGVTGISMIHSLLLGGVRKIIAIDDKVVDVDELHSKILKNPSKFENPNKFESLNKLEGINKFESLNIDLNKELLNKKVFSRSSKDLNSNDLDSIDTIFVSPGIPAQKNNKHHIIQQAEALKIPIMSDIELLYEVCPNAFYIAITGTNGKSSTANMLYHVLSQYIAENRKNAPQRSKFPSVQLGGNIGIPVLYLDPVYTKNDIFVLEVSSYQLDLIRDTAAVQFDISVLLNVYEDHMDRYGDIYCYAASKARIFRFQSKDTVPNDRMRADDSLNNLSPFSHTPLKGCSFISSTHEMTNYIIDNFDLGPNIVKFSTKELESGNTISSEKILKSEKVINSEKTINSDKALNSGNALNSENVLAVIAISQTIGIHSDKTMEILRDYNSIKYCMQEIYRDEKIVIVNDSKATNCGATINAIRCYDNIHLILGGVVKEENIIKKISPYFDKIDTIYLIGSSTDRFASELEELLSKGISEEMSGKILKILEKGFEEVQEEISEWIQREGSEETPRKIRYRKSYTLEKALYEIKENVLGIKENSLKEMPIMDEMKRGMSTMGEIKDSSLKVVSTIEKVGELLHDIEKHDDLRSHDIEKHDDLRSHDIEKHDDLRSHDIEKHDDLRSHISPHHTKKATILFAPACASFDQWNNYAHRGADFDKLIAKIFPNSTFSEIS